MKRCVHCGNDKFADVKETQVYRIGRAKYPVKMPARKCTRCGEGYFKGDDLLRAELAVAALVPVSGPRDGDGFRFMRKAVGYPANELAALLQRTPETVSRWEHGKGEIEPLAWMLLDALVHDLYSSRFHDGKLPRRLSREILEALAAKPKKPPELINVP